MWLFSVSLFLSSSLFPVFHLSTSKKLFRSFKNNNNSEASYFISRTTLSAHMQPSVNPPPPLFLRTERFSAWGERGRSLVVFVPYTRALSLLLFPGSQFIFVTLNPSKLPVKPQKCLRKSFSSWKRAFYAYFGITLMPRNQAVRHVDEPLLCAKILQQSRLRCKRDSAGYS